MDHRDVQRRRRAALRICVTDQGIKKVAPLAKVHGAEIPSRPIIGHRENAGAGPKDLCINNRP
jgi:hypothetical protein